MDDSIEAEPECLLSGYLCECVNLSDWESLKCVGGEFDNSFWSETSNLVTLAESIPFVDRADVVFL